MVDTGSGVVQVVCGAPNARTGMKGVFAPPGSYIPGTGITSRRARSAAWSRNGMLCSAREMGLGDDHGGIIDLPADAPVGEPFAEALGLDDPVIEIKRHAEPRRLPRRARHRARSRRRRRSAR